MNPATCNGRNGRPVQPIVKGSIYHEKDYLKVFGIILVLYVEDFGRQLQNARKSHMEL